MTVWMRCWLMFALVLFLASSALALEDPPELEPSATAETGVVYQTESAGRLRYTWLLPADYDPEAACDVTVILHGTGLDYRWGHWNNPVGIFRPQDIVISVDGTTADGKSRLFLGEKKDAQAFHEFLEELRERFAVDDLFLYGHSQGGFFAIYFAGEFPKDVDGAVAHASGAWNWSKMGSKLRDVPLAFMHGTADPVVPYRQSPGSRDAYRDKGFKLLHLRRLQGYNHWPNAVRATEVIGWCDGMSTDDPAEALAQALEILRSKKFDQYQYQTVVGFSAARDILRRLVGEGPAAFKDVDAKLARDAAKWIKAIEAQGARHVSALRKEVGSKKQLKLSKAPWLGHLLALREDFRGVDCVEEYMDRIGFDELVKKQSKSRDKIIEAFYSEKKDQEMYETIVPEIPRAFLFEGYPQGLVKLLERLHGQAKSGKYSKKAVRAYEQVEDWKTSMEQGFKEYESLWKEWKGPGE